MSSEILISSRPPLCPSSRSSLRPYPRIMGTFTPSPNSVGPCFFPLALSLCSTISYPGAAANKALYFASTFGQQPEALVGRCPTALNVVLDIDVLLSDVRYQWLGPSHRPRGWRTLSPDIMDFLDFFAIKTEILHMVPPSRFGRSLINGKCVGGCFSPASFGIPIVICLCRTFFRD